MTWDSWKKIFINDCKLKKFPLTFYFSSSSRNMVTKASSIRILSFWVLILCKEKREVMFNISKLTIIGLDNGLSPGRRQAII